MTKFYAWTFSFSTLRYIVLASCLNPLSWVFATAVPQESRLSYTPVPAINLAAPLTISKLEQIVMADMAGAFNGNRCTELAPALADDGQPDRNRILVAYLKYECASSLLDSKQREAELRSAMSESIAPSSQYFNETLIHVYSLLDALAYQRASNVAVVSMYLAMGGGGRFVFLQSVVQQQDRHQSVWRFDITTSAEYAVEASSSRINAAGYDLQMAKDLPGLVYLMGTANEDPASAMALVGKAIYLSGIEDPSPKVADIRTLLESASWVEGNNAYAKWLLANSLLGEVNNADITLIAKAAVLAKDAANQELVEGTALVAAMSEVGVGMPKSSSARDTAFSSGVLAVGRPHMEYLVSQAFLALKGRVQTQAASDEWLERAAKDGDGTAQNQWGIRCIEYHAPSSKENCREHWYGLAAAQGQVMAMHNLGVMYQNADGVKKDFETARRWFERAKDLDSPGAFNDLGYLYQTAVGPEKDLAKAASYYRQGAERGDPWAENNLALLLRKGAGVPRDYTEAVRWSRLSAFQGNLGGVKSLADALDSGQGLPRDSRMAFGLYKSAALRGDAASMLRVGEMYQEGRGIEMDLPSAARWFLDAANVGNVSAINKRAWMLFEGSGVTKNQAEAETWFRKSAEAGDSEGMRGLGYALLFRAAPSPDVEKGLGWFKRAADAGSAAAMQDIAAEYRQGTHVSKDIPAAMRWFERAANAGDLDSMNSLGWIYEHGEGVDKDETRAAAWYKRAAEVGSVDAINNYARHLQFGLGVKQDVEGAKKLFEDAATKGSHHAKCNLGFMLLNQNSNKQDQDRGWLLLVNAADSGNEICQREVGIAYRHGSYSLSKADLEQAKHYLGLAVEQGDADAKAEATDITLEASASSAEQAASARNDLKTLADDGNARAQALLANECIVANGGETDYVCARQYFEAAANQNAEFAAFCATVLGEMLIAGHGGPQDFSAAERWLRVGTKGGLTRAYYDLGTLLLHEKKSAEGADLLKTAALSGHAAAAYRYLRYCREAKDCKLDAKLKGTLDEKITKLTKAGKNNWAWAIACDPLSDTEDGKFAVHLLETIDATERNQYITLDTVAASEARAGEFEKAVDMQQVVLADAITKVSASTLRQMKARLESYRRHQTWDGPS